MPPKKKVDPETLQQQFEQWKESTEYKKWEEMSEGLKKYPPITETTLDINGPWQEYYDELIKFFQIMKAKTGKIKEIEHEHIRSFFFAHEDKENEKIIIDGIQCGVTKEHADRAWTLRHKFCDILKAFSDIEDLDFENFQTNKKNLQKTINEFFKYYNPHVKSGHKEIYDNKIAKVFEPLNNLIEINTVLVNFNKKYKTDYDREINSFRVKALTEKYCQAYSEVQRVLEEDSKDYKLFATCDLRKTFYKLSYKNWENNPCEKLYILPLRENLKAMQKQLMDLFAYGINFWKIPLCQNEDLVREIENLVKSELIADRLLGTPLRRELFNFVYKVVQIIKEANPYLESNLLKKDENTVNISIPKLVVFKLIQHMKNWKLKKQENEKMIEERNQRLQMINKMKEEQKSNSLASKLGKTVSGNNLASADNTKAVAINILPNNSSTINNTTQEAKDASFFNSSNNQVTSPNANNNISVNLSFLARDKQDTKESVKEKILEDLTPRKGDISMLNASITTSATYNNAVYHTSTKTKMLKSVSQLLPVKTSIKSPTNKQEVFNFADQLEDKIEDPAAEDDLIKYGRYFYLEGYVSQEIFELFEVCVDQISRINPAVQQDIEDYIILQGFTPKIKDRHDQQRVEARLKLEKLQEQEFSDSKINSTRPPDLWNFPQAIETHKFRSIVKPKDCYVDGRFEEFDQKLDMITQNLISFKPTSWRQIVSRVIDVFANSYQKEITSIDPSEILQ
ncbi:hypothetical protein ABPG72_001280 [Tetrahymena utriculariae]